MNSPAKREAVREVVTAYRTAILCMQETKIDCWSTYLAREVGGTWLDQCIVLPAIGTRGGATIFWNSSMVTVQSHFIGDDPQV